MAGEVARPTTFSLAELAALPQVERAIDIHCVTRWSKLNVPFTGVLLQDLLALVSPLAAAKFVSFVARSSQGHSTSLRLADALQLGALVALQCDGQPLAIEHGGPVRVVVPGRYFYKSIKWLERIELLVDDRLGFWEAQSGYHNVADPWREERFVAAGIPRHELPKLLATLDWSGRDLLNLDVRGLDLVGLVARGSLLRNAHFESCQLTDADFAGANLSNAHFAGSNLQRASFRDADAEGSDFVGSDLRGADFRGASLLGATFVDSAAALPTIEVASTLDYRGPARLDKTTRFDDCALAELALPQAEFLRAASRD